MAQYTRETLEALTVRELRRLVVDLGIAGYTKKRKDIIVDVIMSRYGTQSKPSASIIADGPTTDLNGVEATFQSSITKPELGKRERLSTTIQVSCGASSGRFPVTNRSVAEVADFLREVLNVDKLSTGLVNGKEVSGDYILKGSDVLEFLKPAGRKG